MTGVVCLAGAARWRVRATRRRWRSSGRSWVASRSARASSCARCRRRRARCWMSSRAPTTRFSHLPAPPHPPLCCFGQTGMLHNRQFFSHENLCIRHFMLTSDRYHDTVDIAFSWNARRLQKSDVYFSGAIHRAKHSNGLWNMQRVTLVSTSSLLSRARHRAWMRPTSKAWWRAYSRTAGERTRTYVTWRASQQTRSHWDRTRIANGITVSFGSIVDLDWGAFLHRASAITDTTNSSNAIVTDFPI